MTVDSATIESTGIVDTVAHNRSLMAGHWTKQRDQFSSEIIVQSRSCRKALRLQTASRASP